MRYAPRLFDLAEQISAQRGAVGHRGRTPRPTALRFTSFPRVVADEELIALRTTGSRATDLTGFRRRIIAECRDEARRAAVGPAGERCPHRGSAMTTVADVVGVVERHYPPRTRGELGTGRPRLWAAEWPVRIGAFTVDITPEVVPKPSSAGRTGDRAPSVLLRGIHGVDGSNPKGRICWTGSATDRLLCRPHECRHRAGRVCCGLDEALED